MMPTLLLDSLLQGSQAMQNNQAFAQLLPVWAVTVLIGYAGAATTTIAAMIWRAIEVKAIDSQITGLRNAMETQLRGEERARDDQFRNWERTHLQGDTAVNKRLDDMETALFGIDGTNGMRGESKENRMEVRAMAIVLRRLAEAASIDTKELDALNAN